jgi:putative membrane protein
MCLYTILRWVVNALILMLIPYIVPGVRVENFFTALVVAVVLALVNALIKPILIIFTLPINILTLGLFTLVINGLMFYIVSAIVKGFFITDFLSAFLAALVYSLISLLVSYLDHPSSPSVKRLN